MSERIGVKPEQITFFDDNHTALINGKKAGHRVVGVRDIQKEETVAEIKIQSINSLTRLPSSYKKGSMTCLRK